VDVRVIAATNRDLRAEVNAGRFRSDLFFRLAVVKLAIPPLRQRPEDIPPIVERMLGSLAGSAELSAPLRTPEFLAKLQRAAWPGNIRELRNHMERCLVLEDALPPVDDAVAEASPSGAIEVDPNVAYAEARRRALDGFERAYVTALLKAHQGKVSQAASAADVDRVYLYRLMRRHGLKAT
jgi:DNA-binding NtrC family response regulator